MMACGLAHMNRLCFRAQDFWTLLYCLYLKKVFLIFKRQITSFLNCSKQTRNEEDKIFENKGV